MTAIHNPAVVRKPKEQMRPLRIAIICDFAEENWPSMDLIGDMLFAHLQAEHAGGIEATQVRPPMSFAVPMTSKGTRLYARFVQYPRLLRKLRGDFDLFHIVDHSYSQLVHELPANRTVVNCHDLDTFRSILHPQEERRSAAFRAMTRRILSGMQKAAYVVCGSDTTRASIREHNLIPAEKLSVVHNGVHPAFRAEPEAASDDELTRVLNRRAGDVPELLHVGSTIRRKRIDVLLQVFASLRKQVPHVRLLRVGGAFSEEQEKKAKDLGIFSFIDVLPRLEPRLIASAYRRAACTLLPSDAEGFGLPIIESLACGTPVIASDIAALREIGGPVVRFCPVGDIGEWTSAVVTEFAASRDSSTLLTYAANFSWTQYAARMKDIYHQVLAG